MLEDRVEAGKKLFEKLDLFKNKKDALIVGLTRGGVVTAKELAKDLNLRLVPLIVKKISLPLDKELAIGAIVDKKNVYWNEDLCQKFNINLRQKKNLILEKQREISRLKYNLKIKYNPNILKNKTVLIVDDGVATGATAIAAGIYARNNKVKKIILVTPVIASDLLSSIKSYFDDVIFLISASDFYSVGEFYNNFPQISDEETAKILKT